MRPIYDLFSICQLLQQNQSTIFILIKNHSGNLGGGHYTAYAKNRDTQDWYLFDDSKVSSVKNPFKEILSQKAYVLFYSKTSINNFQRQTISRPDQWPHILNDFSLNQHPSNINESNQNQKKQFSALSIQKQGSRNNQQILASNNNISSLKSTPQNYHKQVKASTLNYLFDDDNKMKEKEQNKAQKYQKELQNQQQILQQKQLKGKMSPKIEEKEQNEHQEIQNLDLTEQSNQQSPLIKSNNKQFKHQDKDYMPIIISHSRVGSFSKKQQQLSELKQKEAYPANGQDSSQQQLKENSFDLTPFSINLNENLLRNESPEPFMLKVKKVSINQKSSSNEKNQNIIDNSFSQKELSPRKINLRNNRSREDFHNSQNDLRGQSLDGKGNMLFQNDYEINQKQNVSLIPQFDQFSLNQKFHQNKDSPKENYQSSSKGELPKIFQNPYRIKNIHNNSQNSKEQNDFIQNFDSSKESQFNNNMSIYHTKNNSQTQIGNGINRRSVQEVYDNSHFLTNLYGLQANKNQEKQIYKSERYGGEKRIKNNDYYKDYSYNYDEEDVKLNDKSGLFNNLNEDQEQKLFSQQQHRNLSSQQASYRNLSYDQPAHTRQKYSHISPQKNRVNNEILEKNLPSALTAQLLMGKKILIKQNIKGISGSIQQQNSQDLTQISESNSKNKISNTQLLEQRQRYGGGYTSLDVNPTQQKQNQQSILPNVSINSSEIKGINQGYNNSIAHSIDQSPTRPKRYSGLGNQNQSKHSGVSQNKGNNIIYNSESFIQNTFNSTQKSNYKNM